MSDKYIIKNCPICEHCDWDNGYGELEEGYICKRITIDSFECKDIENCLLKQIVELAKGHTELCKNCEQQIKECDCNDICNAYRLNKILQLLDIQEIE